MMTRVEVLEVVAQYAKENEKEVVICAIGESFTGTNGQVVYGKPSEVVNMTFNVIKNNPPMAMILLDNVDVLIKIALETDEHSS